MPLLSIIIPTYNESDNIKKTINNIEKVMGNFSYEIIVVDDNSPDNTAEKVRQLSRKKNNIRCIHRIGRRGLSSACLEGFLSSSSSYIAVMDADGQHDETLLPKMLSSLREESIDLINASRYMKNGSTGTLSKSRVFISRIATKLSNLILPYKITDPMSGFFMFKTKSIFPYYQLLSAQGFKILLDILVNSNNNIKLKELPYKMKQRSKGQSKLDSLVVTDFFWVFIEKLIGYKISRQFIAFLLVGFSGLFVHFLTLAILNQILDIDFTIAQASSILVAMTSNFFLNNQFTYKQNRLTGFRVITGLFSFYLACTLGALINWQFSILLYNSEFIWWLAGLSGAIVGAVWNYTMTRIFTWKAQ